MGIQSSLCTRLGDLLDEVGAENALVFDENGLVHGYVYWSESESAIAQVRGWMTAALDSSPKRLRRGGAIDLVRQREPWLYARSFANVYVLLLGFAGPFGDEVRARALAALPKIEALTLALPPQGGPGVGAIARRLR